MQRPGTGAGRAVVRASRARKSRGQLAQGRGLPRHSSGRDSCSDMLQRMGRGGDVDVTEPRLLNPPSAARTGNELLLVAGNGQLSTHELTGREIVIGRGEDCDVVIDHRSLSRRHAVLRLGPPLDGPGPRLDQRHAGRGRRCATAATRSRSPPARASASGRSRS